MNYTQVFWMLAIFLFLNIGFPTIMKLLGIEQHSYLNLVIWVNLLILFYIVL